MPEGLTETYTRIVHDIDRKHPEQRALAIACFRWILSADRSLHWTELQTALAFSGSKPPETLQELYDDHSCLTYITSVCGNLVHFPRNPGAPFWDEEKATFIHASVFEFFSAHLSTLSSLSGSWSILSDTRSMHCRNALDCLNMMRLKLDNITPEKPLVHQIDYTSFNYYAINHFDKHLLASESSSEHPSRPVVLVQQMLKQDRCRLQDILMMRLYLKPSMGDGIQHVSSAELRLTVIPEHIIWSTQLHRLYTRFPRTMSPSRLLLTLVKAELVVAVNNLIQEGVFRDGRYNINETEGGDSALYIACERGNTEIVGSLLHAGVWPQPDLVAPPCWIDVETPLFRAILEGNTSVVDLLLKAGVDVNVPTNLYSWYTYPLQLAEIHEYPDIAKLLLEYGADRSLFEKGKVLVADEIQTVPGAERC
jgi:ankyrin repeat protein